MPLPEHYRAETKSCDICKHSFVVTKNAKYPLMCGKFSEVVEYFGVCHDWEAKE